MPCALSLVVLESRKPFMSNERVKDRKREGEREKERIKQITWAKIRDTTSTPAPPSVRPKFSISGRFPEQRFWENWLDEKHALRISRPICGTPQNWKIRAAVRVRAFIATTMVRRHATIRVADQRAESSRRRGSPPLSPRCCQRRVRFRCGVTKLTAQLRKVHATLPLVRPFSPPPVPTLCSNHQP